MKREYESPTVDKVEFRYEQQVVADSGKSELWNNTGYNCACGADNIPPAAK